MARKYDHFPSMPFLRGLVTLALALPLVIPAAGTAWSQPPDLFFLHRPGLERAAFLLKQGAAHQVDALKRLMARADKALITGPWSVTAKGPPPPSGDLRDYFNQAPYWWPRKAKPHIRRDGRVNPAAIKASADKKAFNSLCRALETLSLAYYFTGHEVYARRAASLIRGWFLNPSTAMNPNLNHAQMKPGRNLGSPGGIIEFRNLGKILDAVLLVRNSANWSEKDQAAFERWCRNYLDWLTGSNSGRREAAAANNHGTWFSVQALCLSRFLGRTQQSMQIAISSKKRIAGQIRPDGSMPLELARTRSFHYSLFNLEGFFRLAGAAECAGVDLWNYRGGQSGGIKDALNYLIPYLDPARNWPYEQITPHRPRARRTMPWILRKAYLVYGDADYHDFEEQLRPGEPGRGLLELTLPARTGLNP